MKLSKSQSHYIKAIYELSSVGDNGVRVCDVAEKLQLSKASVSLAMTKLERQRMLSKDAQRHVHLTRDGEHEAIRIMNTFETIYKFLVKILSVDKDTAKHDAYVMENVISADTLCAICRFTCKKDLECEGNCPMSIKNKVYCPGNKF